MFTSRKSKEDTIPKKTNSVTRTTVTSVHVRDESYPVHIQQLPLPAASQELPDAITNPTRQEHAFGDG